MNKIPRILPGLLLLTGLSGCASLSDWQRKTVADYAQLTQDYTQYPSEVARAYVSLNYEVATLPLAYLQFDNSKVHNDMVTNLAVWDQGNKNVQRVDAAITVLRNYAEALGNLSSVELSDNLGQSADVLGKTLDKAVTTYNSDFTPATPLPTGFGKLAGDALSVAGTRYINHRQARALRSYMSQGDTLLQLLDKDAQQAFRELSDRWTLQRKLIEAQHETLLKRAHEGADPAARIFYSYQINKDMAVFLQRASAFEDLLKSTPQAMSNVYRAHQSVLDDIRKKRTFKERIANLQQLYEDVSELRSEYQKLTRPASK